MRPHVSPSASRTRRSALRSSRAYSIANDIETGDDLGEAAQIEEVAARGVILLRAPLLGHPAEGAKVPGCDEEVAVEIPGRRNRLV
jgi:hypothetical protein